MILDSTIFAISVWDAGFPFLVPIAAGAAILVALIIILLVWNRRE